MDFRLLSFHFTPWKELMEGTAAFLQREVNLNWVLTG